jgi:hypothetical protein
MKEMSEKQMYRILNLVSLLALSYYVASSIKYIFESDSQIYSYDNQSNDRWSTAKLKTHQLD